MDVPQDARERVAPFPAVAPDTLAILVESFKDPGGVTGGHFLPRLRIRFPSAKAGTIGSEATTVAPVAKKIRRLLFCFSFSVLGTACSVSFFRINNSMEYLTIRKLTGFDFADCKF